MTKKLTDLTEVTATEDGDLLLIRDATDGVDKKMQAQNLRAKATTKDDVGLANVPDLDTTDAVSKAHDQNTDSALDQGGANEVTAADARAHIDATDNPHSVTKTQVGLGDVDNVSAADLRDRSTHTGTQTLSTISDAGTIASQDANNVNIDGGTIDGTAVNATTLTASDDVNFDSGALFVDASERRVGVNTSSPQTTLEVNSSSEYMFGLKYGNDSTRRSMLATNAGSNNNYNGFRIESNFANPSTSSHMIEMGSFSANGDALKFYRRPPNGSYAEQMRIDSSGNILAATGGGWVGTVSESGQSSVIERGSNANGEYVKYADGTMICWTPYSLGYTLSGLTAGSFDDWTFPATFSGEDVYSATADADGQRNSGLVPWAGSRGRAFDIRFRTEEDVSATTLHLYAIGRWY